MVASQFKPKGRFCFDCLHKKEKECTAKWAAGHKEHLREYCREYWAARLADNPELSAQKSARRRAAKLNAIGNFCAEDINLLRQLQDDSCAYCGSNLAENCAADHIFPISKYFYNGPENIQLLCRFCNSSKNDKDPYEYESKMGFVSSERLEKLDAILALIEQAHSGMGVENYEIWRHDIRNEIAYENSTNGTFDYPPDPAYYEPRYTYEMWGHT